MFMIRQGKIIGGGHDWSLQERPGSSDCGKVFSGGTGISTSGELTALVSNAFSPQSKIESLGKLYAQKVNRMIKY